MIAGGSKNRLLYFLRVLIAGIFLFFAPSHPGFAQTPAESIQALDARYYYPQHQGLRALRARVTWTQMTPFSEEKEYLTNPSVIFKWNGANNQRDFEIHPDEKDVSGERTLEILGLFRNYKELILPLPLEKKLEGYKARAHKPTGKFIQLSFESASSSNPVQKYFFLVDPRRHHISKFRMIRSQVPRQVTVSFKYTRQEDHWLVSESAARFNMHGKDYQEVTQYQYGNVKGFWLPSQVTQTLYEENAVRHSNIFRLDQFQVKGNIRATRNPE